MVRPEGLEPPAYRFEACRSIQLSYGRATTSSVADGSIGGKRLGREESGGRCRPDRHDGTTQSLC